jgi:lipopolysaccharide transport system ATP-binding protein
MSPDNPAIHVSHLGKKYTIGGPQEKYLTFRDAIVNSVKAPFKRFSSHEPTQEFWALKDVSFDVEQGEVVGIIGRNGAGKSTLLKILSRITSPSEGTVDLCGRVGSLLEVGTGFHPELTGRENIFLSGSILGMKRREIDSKLDDIVKFSEIEKFLDTPVKRYSSGMYVRLAFAVAAHMDTEILLVDEVLAVGDAQFQKKCMGKMGDVAAKEGRTVLFVSHNMGAVSQLCPRSLNIANGKIVADGKTTDVVDDYINSDSSEKEIDISQLRSPKNVFTPNFLMIKMANPNHNVKSGDPLIFNLKIYSESGQNDLSIGCSIFHINRTCVGTLFTERKFSIDPNCYLDLELIIAETHLAPGMYYTGFSIGKGDHFSGRLDYDIVIGTPQFQIIPISENYPAISNWNSNWGSIIFDNAKLTITEMRP